MEIGRRMFLRSLVGVVGTGLVTKSFGEAILPLAEKVLQIPTITVDPYGEKSPYRTISAAIAALGKKGIVRALPGVYSGDMIELPPGVRIVCTGSATITGCYFKILAGRKPTDSVIDLPVGNMSITNCAFMGEDPCPSAVFSCS